MQPKKLRIILSLFNLLVTALFAVDTFMLPVTEKMVVLKDKAAERTSGSRGHGGHLTYILTDENGNTYNVPRDFFLVLDINEGFIISRSGLFKKAIAINYHLNHPEDKANIGVINAGVFGRFAMLLITVLSVLTLYFPRLFKQEDTANRTSIMAAMITVVMIFFYFVYQA